MGCKHEWRLEGTTRDNSYFYCIHCLVLAKRSEHGGIKIGDRKTLDSNTSLGSSHANDAEVLGSLFNTHKTSEESEI